MASPHRTSFAGDKNQGFQVGHNSGSIEMHFHATSPERPETPPQPSCFVPFRRDPDFVARGVLLEQIRERCAVPACRVALVGLGGVGKSQLAIEHCHRTVDEFPNTWVFWVHASNTARLEQSFRAIAEQVKLHDRKSLQANVFELVRDWLQDARNGPWLVVIDNADKAGVLGPRASNGENAAANNSSNDNPKSLKQRLSNYLPPSKQGRVLVTSRTRRAAMQIVEANDIIQIEPMDDASACALLHNKLGPYANSANDTADLAASLDYMPLALVQAAAYIRDRAPRYSMQQYLDQYHQSDSQKTSLLNQEAGRLRRDEAASNSILITWQINFDHVRRERQSAADLLSLMSFFDRQGIQESLLRKRSGTVHGGTTNATANDSFEEDIVTLRDYSFITVTKDTDTFEMHSLVQLATRTWLANQRQVDEWRKQFIANLFAALPKHDWGNSAKWRVLFPHAKAALAQRPDDSETLEEWASLLYEAASYAEWQGIVDEAEEMSTVSMEVRRQVLGEEHAKTLDSMQLVGMARELGGKHVEAEAIIRQALTRSENLLGVEHISTLSKMAFLVVVLLKQGENEEAMVVHRNVLARIEKIPEPGDRAALVEWQTLVLVLQDWRMYGLAEKIARQLLATSEKVLGHEHWDTLTYMENLAHALHNQGKNEEAEAIYRRVLARVEKELGPEHLLTLKCVSVVARSLAAQECYEESYPLFDRAYKGYHKLFGENNHSTRNIRKDLGNSTNLHKFITHLLSR